MLTKQNPAAPAASHQSPNRAFFAEGRQFLTTIRGAAKKAGVPLDEFLIRAAFESERGKDDAEVSHPTVSFVRTVVRFNKARRFRMDHAITNMATCDMPLPGEDGATTRELPLDFDLVPESQAKEDARWLNLDDFMALYDLDLPNGRGVDWSTLENKEGGGFQTRKIGNPSAGICIHNCIPFPVACWFYGFDPKWLQKSGGMCMSKWSGLEDNIEPHSIHRLLRGEIPRLPIGTKLKLPQDRASFVGEPFQDRDGEWKIEVSGPLAEGVKLLAERKGITPDQVMNDALRDFMENKKAAAATPALAAA